MAVLSRPVTPVNPIEWQESRFQQKNRSAFLRRYQFALPVMLGVLTLLVILSLRDMTFPTRNVGIYLIWIVHALVVARAIAAGANAISREHVSKTWDVLMLTGVNTRQILLGKWLAVLRQVAPWTLGLACVRLVMIPVFMMSLVNRFAWRAIHNAGYYYNTGSYDLPLISWRPESALMAVVMTVMLTLLEAMACTAIGLAASAITRKGWSAMIAAFCVRFAPVMIFAAFTQYEVGDQPSWRVLSFTPLSLADSGTSTLYLLSLPLTNQTFYLHGHAMTGILLATSLLIVFATVSLWLTNRAIRRSGALSLRESRM
jgi:ABC-type transport system involved in multi-copper enzyme maturation permease subunit